MQKDLSNRFFVENKLFKWSSFTGACFLGKMVYKKFTAHCVCFPAPFWFLQNFNFCISTQYTQVSMDKGSILIIGYVSLIDCIRSLGPS